MKQLYSLALFGAVSVIAGCIVGHKTGGIGDPALIERARAKVWQSSIALSPGERDVVMSTSPKTGIYRLAGDYADYHFIWEFDNMRIVVKGRGELSNLEEAEVKKTLIQEKDHAQEAGQK
jgi:hypothetical protein